MFLHLSPIKGHLAAFEEDAAKQVAPAGAFHEHFDLLVHIVNAYMTYTRGEFYLFIDQSN